MSTRSGNRSKHKRSVPTTLGRAPPNSNSELIDLSHLRKPIDTSVFGLSQILSLFETATDEVRRYITYECDLMFECRVCRTVFRSLANFILHKRNYCPEFFNTINDSNKTDYENNELAIIDKDNLLSSPKEKIGDIETTPRRYPRRNLSLVLQKLSDRQECERLAADVVNEKLTQKEEISEDLPSKTICLESIDNNKEGVFQTMNCKQIGNELMKSEVMEIHSILNTNEAILGPDGKVFSFRTEINDTGGQKLMCTICNLKFATKKTLTHHIKYKHNETRVVYICPECKDSFANAWCVFRHLYKIHRKTTTQIRRMRDQIHSSTIIKKQEIANKKTCSTVEIKNDGDNQLNNPYYDFESHFCEGCFKRFERKAALNSHIQGCLKRVVANNVIKEKEKDSQELIIQQSMDTPKGSSKRKSKILQRIIKNNKLEVIIRNEETQDRNDELHIENRNNLEQIRECNEPTIDSSSNENNMSTSEEQIDHNDSITKVKDSNYQKRLIQEIIFGSGEKTTDDALSETPSTNKYIGLVSDEEEVLGFVKESDILVKDNLTDKNIEESEQTGSLSKDNSSDKNIEGSVELISTHQTGDSKEECIYIEDDAMESNKIETDIKVESTRIYIPVSNHLQTQNSIIPVITDIEVLGELPSQDVTVENINDELTEVQDLTEEEPKELLTINLIDNEDNMENQNIAAEQVDKLLKNPKLRQYGPKKAKATNLAKLLEKDHIVICASDDEVSKEVIADSNISNTNTTEIDLSPDIQTTDIAIAAEYDIAEVIDISESEGTESCSCFDEKSNDSFSSYGSKKNVGANVITHDSTVDKMLINLNENDEITQEQFENIRLSRKRKISTEIQADDDANSSLVKKCNDYVDWNEIMCHPCLKRFSTGPDLLKHMALHFNWMQYQCNICNFISYDRKTCTEHILKHDINTDSLHNFIVLLPYWKTLCMATPFNKDIDEQDDYMEHTMVLNNESANPNNSDINDNERVNKDKSENASENINKDQLSVTCSASKIKTQDPLLRKMIMEVIFGSEQNAVKKPSETNINTRPIRNRVSVKSLQKDFEYDMRQIDTKVKKASVDNKVKPIKIVKNNEENFHIVNSNISQSVHKKKRTY